MLKKVLVLWAMLAFFGIATVASAQEEGKKELTPRQQLLDGLPKDTAELVFIGEDTIATWGVTKTSGEPLEIIESVMLAENGIIETTIWAVGTDLRSILVITKDQELIPQIVVNFQNRRIEVAWQKRAFSKEELGDIVEYSTELAKAVLGSVGIMSDEELKRYTEKNHI